MPCNTFIVRGGWRQTIHERFGRCLSFYEREYTNTPTPRWRSTIPQAGEGEKHPSERGHSERLERLQRAIQAAVARNVSVGNGRPVLVTAISSAKADSLETLHRLCDWVVTLDRNAGIEYFDSPRDNRAVYDAYVIDCVPGTGHPALQMAEPERRRRGGKGSRQAVPV